MLDAAKGCLALHSRHPPIIHCNLNSSNLLVDGDWRVKVADLTLAKLASPQAVDDNDEDVHAHNPRWQAPEVVAGGPATIHSVRRRRFEIGWQ